MFAIKFLLRCVIIIAVLSKVDLFELEEAHTEVPSDIPMQSNNNTLPTDLQCEPLVYTILIIDCRINFENLGRNIDGIIENHKDLEIKTLVQFININFPDAVLEQGWYDGNESIEVMTFVSCHLAVIMPNAFKTRAFENLSQLGFINNSHIEMKTDALAHLNQLKLIAIFNTNLVSFNRNFLKPLHKRLRGLFYSGLPSTIAIGQVFGDTKLSALEDVELRGNLSGNLVSRTISPKDFAQLRAIQILRMHYCGIETILAGTFDFISETLFSLNLSDNKLKTIDIDLLWDFLDRPRLKKKSLWIWNNNFTCDCQFYELSNFSTLFSSVKVNIPENEQRLSCIPPEQHVPCDRLQTISAYKFIPVEGLNEKYSLPKIILRIRDGNLIVKSESIPKVRLIAIQPESMGTRKRSKCPRSEWLESSVSCTILNAKSESFSVIGLEEWSTLTIFCAILPMTHKRAWPLHCQSINLALRQTEMDTDYLMFGFVFVVGSLIGFFAPTVYKIWYLQHNANERLDVETKVETEVEEDMQKSDGSDVEYANDEHHNDPTQYYISLISGNYEGIYHDYISAILSEHA